MKKYKPTKVTTALLETHNRFNIRVSRCRYGRGVFAGQDFQKGELIEVCPMLIVDDYSATMAWVAGQSDFERYFFDFDGVFGIALGYGSLYNHSKTPNALYIDNSKGNELIIYASKNIKKGYQVFIDYGYEPKK